MQVEYREVEYIGVEEIQGQEEVTEAYYLGKSDVETLMNCIQADVDEVLDILEEQGSDGISEAIEMLVELQDKLQGGEN